MAQANRKPATLRVASVDVSELERTTVVRIRYDVRGGWAPREIGRSHTETDRYTVRIVWTDGSTTTLRIYPSCEIPRIGQTRETVFRSLKRQTKRALVTSDPDAANTLNLGA